jgi:hypothetical protein
MVGHPVWTHAIIWEKALFKSIRDELRNNSPAKNMSRDEIERYEQSLIYRRVNGLVTDLLYYFGVEKDVLKLLVKSFCQHSIPSKYLELILNKID